MPRKKDSTTKKTISLSKTLKKEPVVTVSPEVKIADQVYVEEQSVTVEYEVSKEEKKKKLKINFTKVILICLVVACCVALFLFLKSKNLTKNSSAANEKRVKEVVEKVEKLIDLPKDELPSLAIVEDVEMLRGQPFFADASEGDMVLLYGKAQKIFLYNPKKNLVINASALGASD